ncbi:hypothetical protein B0I35DRAFT_439768 [Stachybotrys elegans]|uniref:Zn(2)-C6 fungal-type domain-containing protein n=1 Tax=Stachybotrys elegans TaxID=80388 RepID=A0A8K0SQ19_9HYPO|nr:hypothetical protein B0I35DRAFT_439768 [Stachybotrys elegans]
MDQNRRSPPPSEDSPPSKKQRSLACRRCRHRKQKCEDKRPCSNCHKSGEECLPTEPAPRGNVDSDYVKALEVRVAELESRDPVESRDHAPAFDHASRARHPAQISNDAACYSAPDDSSFSRGDARQRRPSEAAQILQAISTPSPAALYANPRRAYSNPSPGGLLTLADDSDSGMEHLIYGLVTSPYGQREPREDDNHHALSRGIQVNSPRDGDYLPHSQIAGLSPEIEDILLGAYRDRAQSQYPFFHWNTFLSWHADWKTCQPTDLASRQWQGFFVNMVYATAILCLALPSNGPLDARAFYRNGVSLLPSVLRRADPILKAQAYLILTVHAIHWCSTQRILSLASTTIRYCVQNEFHLAETETRPHSPSDRLETQVRRRCFWSAYGMDRLIMSAFNIPHSIPDAMITSKLYANIDDEDLMNIAAHAPMDAELPDSPHYTCVSSALHITQCRRIQSEITGYTLRWDYEMHYEGSSEWRIRILSELESYKVRVQNFTDPRAKGHTSWRWLAMIYHYTLLMLYRPTKETVLGPAGDWAVQASSQACLFFRKSQMDRQVAQAWVGLLVQFQSGVTLLYCFWATPPEHRTENYCSPDVFDAIRACSNILAIMTDRWPKADCLRDVFELLAREVPIIDRPNCPPTRLSATTVATIRDKLPEVRALVVHRDILRMLQEMITDDFPRNTRSPSVAQQRNAAMLSRAVVGESLTTAAFELPFTSQHLFDVNGEDAQVSLASDELLVFPGLFDIGS